MNNGILGKWIAAPETDRGFGSERCDSAPHFRREFEYEEKFEHGRVSISGLGFYELYLNGRKVGDRVLDPGFFHSLIQMSPRPLAGSCTTVKSTLLGFPFHKT